MFASIPARAPYTPVSSASASIISHAEAAIAEMSGLRQAVTAAGVTSSEIEHPSKSVSMPVPVDVDAVMATTRVSAQANGIQSRSRDPPRNQASPAAAAVAGTATIAVRATQVSCSSTPNAVQAN